MNRYLVPSSISIIDKVFFIDSSIQALSMTALVSAFILMSVSQSQSFLHSVARHYSASDTKLQSHRLCGVFLIRVISTSHRDKPRDSLIQLSSYLLFPGFNFLRDICPEILLWAPRFFRLGPKIVS